MDRIGVRELRQHASRYLARVAAGESLEVTDRGRPVARLVPVDDDPWDTLVATGVLQLPTAAVDLLDLELQSRPPGASSLSDALAELRDDQR
jgi:prevent-host-death family protein